MIKFKAWLKSAGLRSIGYLAAGAGLFLFGWSHLAVAAVTVFVVDNFVTIKELVKKGIDSIQGED